MDNYYILQRSDFPVFQRFNHAFAQTWRELGIPARLLARRNIPIPLLKRPECLGLAGGQLYLMTLPRDVLTDKVLINASQRFRGDPRGLNVLVDNEEIGSLAARHLIDKGYRNLVVIEESAHTFSQTRSRAFCKVAENHSISAQLHNIQISPDKFRLENELDILGPLRTFLDQLQEPTGIFGVNDVVAELALRMLEDGTGHGRFPHAVLGVDDLYEEPLELTTCRVPLSSVRPPFEEAGRLAAQRVAESLLDGRDIQGIEVISGAQVVERDSTRGFQTHDPVVHKAIRMISKEIDNREVPRVAQLAERCQVSERTLYNRFQSILNVAPQSYILKQRLSRVCSALSYSDQSITTIALEWGFFPAGILTRHFRKHLGMTPREYRKRFRVEPPA